MSIDRTLQSVWYHRSPRLLFLALAPLSLLFALLSGLRRVCFRSGLLGTVRADRPVIVIGNVTVGGTGKTPLVLWVVEFLQRQGVKVGVISRGYGGNATRWPQDVVATSSPDAVGDEAVLIAHRTGAIVVAGPDRTASARRAIALGADIVVSDDGLQHYRLARDAEIVVIDAMRGFGNGWLLPAGPLREGASRVHRADLIVCTQRGASAHQPVGDSLAAYHEIVDAVQLTTGQRRPLSAFTGTRVHAIAGIGNPEAFFSMLKDRGLDVIPCALRDHAALTRQDIEFPDSAPVLMTEKDAVKCREFASERHWAVQLDVRFAAADEQRLAALLSRIACPTTQVASSRR